MGCFRQAALESGRDGACTQRLCQNQLVADERARFADDFVKMNFAGDGQAIFGFLVADGMPASDDCPRFFDLFSAAAQDFGQETHIKVIGPSGQVNRHQRSATHRIDIAKRVGGRYRAKFIGRIHHRREEIGRRDNRALAVDLINRGIIGLGQPDQHLGIIAVGKGFA